MTEVRSVGKKVGSWEGEIKPGQRTEEKWQLFVMGF